MRAPGAILKALYAGILFNWNTIWGDARGGLSVFECSHNHFHEERAGERASIASANHHQFLDRGLTGSVDPLRDPLIAGSYSRLARMYSLLDTYHGCINPFAAKLIVSDHIPDYSVLKEYGIEREWWEEKVDDSTICAHPWNMRRHLARGEVYPALEEATVSWTVYSFQVRPGRMTVWFTDGHPCRRPTTPYYWGGLLGSGGEPDPGAIDPGTGRARRRETARRGMFMRDTTGFPASVEKVIMGRIEAVENSHFEKTRPGACLTPAPHVWSQRRGAALIECLSGKGIPAGTRRRACVPPAAGVSRGRPGQNGRRAGCRLEAPAGSRRYEGRDSEEKPWGTLLL